MVQTPAKAGPNPAGGQAKNSSTDIGILKGRQPIFLQKLPGEAGKKDADWDGTAWAFALGNSQAERHLMSLPKKAPVQLTLPSRGLPVRMKNPHMIKSLDSIH